MGRDIDKLKMILIVTAGSKKQIAFIHE